MTLPIPLDYAPMEAKLVDAIPQGEAWQYEPKWDGFRCLAFRDGPSIELRSKSGQPFNRYFPEIVEALAACRAPRFVVDGEIVVPVDGMLSFDDLLMRIHPARSRVEKLSQATPGLLVLFDLLVDGDGVALVGRPLGERRAALERFFVRWVPPAARLRLSPATMQRARVDEWLESLGGGLDGIVAKRRDLAYRSGERTAMQKYKRMRTADCVVGGFRYAAKERQVGSLLLGLYGDDALLHHVGFSSNFKAGERATLTRGLEALRAPPGFTGRAPGGPSRWSNERTGEWEPLAPKLVVEVQYDHFSGGRFRHGTRLLRWRPDKAPRQCTLSQVEQESATAMSLLGEPAGRAARDLER